jgi:hypothetical protein
MQRILVQPVSGAAGEPRLHCGYAQDQNGTALRAVRQPVSGWSPGLSRFGPPPPAQAGTPTRPPPPDHESEWRFSAQSGVDTPWGSLCVCLPQAQCNLLSYFTAKSYGKIHDCAGPDQRNPIWSTPKMATGESVLQPAVKHWVSMLEKRFPELFPGLMETRPYRIGAPPQERSVKRFSTYTFPCRPAP